MLTASSKQAEYFGEVALYCRAAARVLKKRNKFCGMKQRHHSQWYGGWSVNVVTGYLAGSINS